MNYKGQADIVFEVLISVILMTFVFIIGAYAMKSLNQTKCSKEIDIAMSSLANALEKAASVSVGSTSYNFYSSSCFGAKDANFKIIQQSGALCRNYCPGSDDCYLLKYENDNDPVMPLRYRCVNVSIFLSFKKKNNGSCTDDASNYVFSPGKYLFKSLSIEKPEICIEKVSQ